MAVSTKRVVFFAKRYSTTNSARTTMKPRSPRDFSGLTTLVFSNDPAGRALGNQLHYGRNRRRFRQGCKRRNHRNDPVRGGRRSVLRPREITRFRLSPLRTVVKEHPHKSPHTPPRIGAFREICGVQVFEKFGSSGRTRTYNPSVNSRMLYH